MGLENRRIRSIGFARLDAARIRVEEFVANGGDLKSAEAGPIGVELVKAFSEVRAEFGHPISKDAKDISRDI